MLFCNGREKIFFYRSFFDGGAGGILPRWEGSSRGRKNSPPDCFSSLFESLPHNTDAKTEDRLLEPVLCFGGVGGIRTLGTLLTYTRFPVVLVMTASIPLHFHVSAALAPASALARSCAQSLLIIYAYQAFVNCFFRFFAFLRAGRRMRPALAPAIGSIAQKNAAASFSVLRSCRRRDAPAGRD